MTEKPSPSGWTYKDGEFVKDPMPDPLPPVIEEEDRSIIQVEVVPGLNPEN